MVATGVVSLVESFAGFGSGGDKGGGVFGVFSSGSMTMENGGTVTDWWWGNLFFLLYFSELKLFTQRLG